MRHLIILTACLGAAGASADEWTGGYAGLQLGGIRLDATATTPFGSFSVDERGALFGVHAGYRHDFGRFVLGGEVDYDATDLELAPGVDIDSLARLKLIAGHDSGPFLPYATVGGTRASGDFGDETGYFGGAGLIYRIDRRFEVGGELLYSSFDDIGPADAEGDVLSYRIRASFRF